MDRSDDLAPRGACHPRADHSRTDRRETTWRFPDRPLTGSTLSSSGTKVRGESIIAQSEILHDGEHWTLVPRGAVLHIPAQHASNVGSRPIGTLLQWSEFLAKNPAWIQARETSFDEASGEAEFPEAHVAHWPKQDRVIVAVHQGGPISVAR